ncbi:hypothetical protein [Collinsella vaginalis]|uniref:hypothetical protein n=1 Tax=Collinsella vaginalis TaxID=1870987 RepID=UPI00117ED84C|nr:hypothetical protein [Collinsella vaginalis]
MSQRSAYGCIERIGARRYRVRWWGDLHDGKGYRRLSKTVHGSRRDARLYLSQMEAAHHEDRPTMTVQDVFDRWYWPSVERRLSDNSLLNYRSAWNRARERWGGVLVSDVRPLEVQAWLNGLTASQTRSCLNVLKPLMDFPVRYEVIPANPFRISYELNRPDEKNGKGIERRDSGVYTVGECIRIARAARGSFMEVPIILSAFGSCRVGESLAPAPGDVREVIAENGSRCALVEVRDQLDRSGRARRRTKTETSARKVVIPWPVSARVLSAARGSAERGFSLVSHNGLGDGIRLRARDREWRRVTDAAGVERHLYKNLRNSWRTYMEWTLRADTEKLEKLMGHVGKGVSAIHYVKPTDQELVDAVADAFAGVEFGDDWDI